MNIGCHHGRLKTCRPLLRCVKTSCGAEQRRKVPDGKLFESNKLKLLTKPTTPELVIPAPFVGLLPGMLLDTSKVVSLFGIRIEVFCKVINTKNGLHFCRGFLGKPCLSFKNIEVDISCYDAYKTLNKYTRARMNSKWILFLDTHPSYCCIRNILK